MIQSAILQQGGNLTLDFCRELFVFQLQFFSRNDYFPSWTPQDFHDKILQKMVGKLDESFSGHLADKTKCELYLLSSQICSARP